MKAGISDKIAFLGAGIIAEVWIRRLLEAGIVEPGQVAVSDVRQDRASQLEQHFAVTAMATNAQSARFAGIVILATPPGEILKVLRESHDVLASGKLVVSLAAGVPIADLAAAAAPAHALRVMPNTPGLVGEAMNLVAYPAGGGHERDSGIEAVLNTLGRWIEVDDAQMDFWCALCAVGPTYLFPVIDALAAAATARGLPADEALQAAAQVVAGAARLVQQSGKTIPQLKEMISIRTLPEAEAAALFANAYSEAVGKLQGLTKRLAAA